ncbi:transporter substrate-binding domain-containing protein [Undibacterium sp. RTI2.2]|uniref:substrate-binding periplasmic protein n=2 Tax=Undibacterium TaxID=401469 RepID=UPI002AB52B52|nr:MULTISPECIES: transporter substrate-binding domain-containing protein [unclassified Undibacterium]MDY7538350.1 transporter substrate-binding domain-containing protein [Undibacterium sp. 5I1]MEB0115026.1 transporter substrate-binding domain-containing protein [Undibacterium sp. RTI2.2]MEB0229375.1 transporter substrate-binding domain-containing protein [Undibacterium sp. 10I3]MEB0255985.1 transporter substrate-binding domain-containing protein [Undibacterium sp. 5I1]
MLIKRLPYSISLAICLICLASQVIAIAKPTVQIRYPASVATNDPHNKYVLELLRTALKNSDNNYRLIPSIAKMQQGRSIYEMTAASGLIDILWTMTTDEREAQLIPVRIPIDKGLIGWRIPIVTRENSDIFKEIKSIKALAALSAGQEQDWPDVGILKSNGLPVEVSTTYEPLFSMLEAGRFMYFPRSIVEVENEYKAHPEQNLHIDTHIALHYQSAYYFFVSPRNPKLAEDIQQGLEEMIKTGEFEKIFLKYHQATIKNINLKNRTIIKLKNPLISPNKLPLNRPELWYIP